MSDNVNANTPQHELFVYDVWEQMRPADRRWLERQQDGDQSYSINDAIRIVRKLIKMGYSRTKVDISVDLDGLLYTQWNDGISLSTTTYDGLYVLLSDLLLLRKWFNAPRTE